MSTRASTTTAQSTLQMMPPEFPLQKKAFEDVAQSLKKTAEMLEADASKATHYSETWDDLSQEFESIIASMHETATSVELCIKEYANAESNSAFDAARDMDTVKSQLAQFEGGLRDASGVNVQKFTFISERLSELKRRITPFELYFNPPNNMKKPTEINEEMIRSQSRPLVFGFLFCSYSRLKYWISKFNSNILFGRFWGVVSALFGGIHFSRKQKQNGNSESNGTLARTAESGGQGMDLKQKQEVVYAQVKAIKESLDSIKCLWMALTADAQELLSQLSLIATRNNVEFFKITLRNLESQCKVASTAFHKFLHYEPVQQAV